jgi:hypothetical protein
MLFYRILKVEMDSGTENKVRRSPSRAKCEGEFVVLHAAFELPR